MDAEVNEQELSRPCKDAQQIPHKPGVFCHLYHHMLTQAVQYSVGLCSACRSCQRKHSRESTTETSGKNVPTLIGFTSKRSTGIHWFSLIETGHAGVEA